MLGGAQSREEHSHYLCTGCGYLCTGARLCRLNRTLGAYSLVKKCLQKPPMATAVNSYVAAAASASSQRVALLSDIGRLQVFTSDLKVSLVHDMAMICQCYRLAYLTRPLRTCCPEQQYLDCSGAVMTPSPVSSITNIHWYYTVRQVIWFICLSHITFQYFRRG